MDKFTVDLDQVLNDFEYSELTDQYSTNDQNKSLKNCNVTQGNNAGSSINQNSIVKHSINNVFHSLNEYLNTDITPKCDIVNNTTTSLPNLVNNQIDNNLLKNTHVEENNTASNQNFVNYQQPVSMINNLKENYNSKVTNTEILLNLSISNEIDKTDDSTIIKENNKHSQEFVENNFEEKSSIQVEDESFKIEPEDNVLVEEIVQSNNEDSLKLGSGDNEVVEKEEQINSDKLEEEIKEPINELHNFEVNEPEISGSVNVKTDDDKIEEKRDLTDNQTVGFSEEVEIDDSELDKYLQTIEQEFESLKTTDDVKEAEIEGKTDSEISDKPILSEDNNAKQLELLTELNKHTIQEIVESNEPIISISEDTIEEKIREDGEILVNYDEVNENSVQKDESDSSLNRPQDLPLNECDDTKRKINLIGDPGSTPYNNVYINKEIPSKNKNSTTNDSDTECSSTSASPTFSEISETSTTSTASTEPVQDECDKEDIIQGEQTNSDNFNNVKNNPSTVVSVDVRLEQDNINQTEDSAIAGSRSVETSGDNSNEVVESGNTNSVEAGRVEEENATSMVENQETEPKVDESYNPNATGGVLLGKEAPLWVPDADALACLHCDMKFTVLKRRHHCRACGLVLCSKCCNLRFKLAYLDAEARVCVKCYEILNKENSSSDSSPEAGNSPLHRPNPNNPAEYCSTISPLQQVGVGNVNPPSVMVPVGVLKRKGSAKSKTTKSVMFCDGIRPGSDLTNLDNDFNYNNTKTPRREQEKPVAVVGKINKNLPNLDADSKSFIPTSDSGLPPKITIFKTDVTYSECDNNAELVETLKNETVTFAVNINLYIHLKIINMDCCVNKICWCFSTEGLINVGQDEIVILLEFIEGECEVPKDIFSHINHIYLDAVKDFRNSSGTSVKEMGLSLHNNPNFLDSKNHAGFVYIRPTFQCLQKIILPKEPYLIGILIHRWETPWAKLFPLRLILRLGAEYRYYPSPLISTRHRDSVFVEIGQTIIKLLADFRNFSYTLPQIRGLTIHMEDKNTTINIPVNRYDQVMKSMNNSSDHILAFAGNFSTVADSHLVCIQDTQGNENCYSTHAINIHNKPRKVTGASFIVFNGALKSSSGLTAKSNIVEDGLMIQILPEHMVQIRENLRNMKNHTIQCGCVNAASDETVNIVWGENDVNFNIGVLSPIDNMSMNGIPSIRVHNGKDYLCNSGNRLIRWTEVFIIQNGDESPKNQDPVDISKISENVAKATCAALVKYLDLLVSNNFYRIAIRATLHVENVSYLAGSNNMKLPPIYMKSLDNELIPVLHKITSNNLGDSAIVLELIFRILNV